MKSKTESKAPKSSKSTVAKKARDLKPKTDAKGGILIGLLLPAVQKVRG